MKAVPKYNVVYKGVMRSGGVPFEIDEADADEMREYCVIHAEKPAAEPEKVTEETPAAAVKPRTRTRKKPA